MNQLIKYHDIIYRKLGHFFYRIPQLRNIMPDKMYLQCLYKNSMGKELDLKNPKTFCEKLQWLKLYDRKPIYTTMVDKVTAKDYVASIIGEKYIIPTIGVYKSYDEIIFAMLPNQFVMKCSHDSGSVVICRDKNTFDIQKARNVMKKGLSRNWYSLGREWPYKNIKPHIIVEKYIAPDSNDLKDYKFFCFNGKPNYCQVISNRSSKMAIDFYDENWVHQDFHEPRNFPFSDELINKPLNYELMLELSSKLSYGHPFLRVDFYEVKGSVYFGELTFYPTNGLGGFSPPEWDLKCGKLITLPQK